MTSTVLEEAVPAAPDARPAGADGHGAGPAESVADGAPRRGRLAVLAAPLRALRSAARPAGPYLGYVGCFVGAGLVSGGIVHYPLEPARYAGLAAAGVVLFLLATVLDERVRGAREGRAEPGPGRVRLVGGSLLLSLGVGMLSGGVQHFADVPDRAAVLVPAGLLLSYVAYQVREAAEVRASLLRPTTGLVVLVAAALLAGLQSVAAGMPAAAGGHDHSTGAAEHTEVAGHTGHTEVAADDEAPAETAPAAPDEAAADVEPAPGSEDLLRRVQELDEALDDLKAAGG